MSVLAKRRADYNEGHPATLPIADYLPPPEPTPFQDPVYFTRAPDLNDNEIAHFKRDGFIVKRGLIDDPAVFAEVVDLIWSKVPRELMRRHDPETWVSPVDSEWTETDSLKVGMLARDNWKIRSKSPSGIGTEALLVDGIANHQKVKSVVGRLIGRPVKTGASGARRILYIPIRAWHGESLQRACGLYLEPRRRHGSGR